MVNVYANGKSLPMEVDTGAAVSIISEETWKNIFPNSTLCSSDLSLTTYSNENLSVIGEMPMEVLYGRQKAQLMLVVASGKGPTLLGRNWLQHL